ncbi:acetyl-CoA C-acyltransferase [Emticicia sp. 21SJ11W-3]|uniref:thiolase family protein n=1 Tax=Emticicia sp. 21SJ11W-3 TaxID=2916755 RepID=UPI0020A0123F|nr:acetyl-CoA C-acyltransferase [Emticicia sp. 21SJ11W-3]UTA66154.1 acetyl-CoA C-acyltransferase [Emticicia sp. 21SJ11W-3]
MKKAYILSAVRTPIGSFGGALSSVPAPKLGAIAVKKSIEKAGVSADDVDELFFGNVCQANVGQAPARQAALYGGLSAKTNTTTINKVCASGMKSVILGSQSIELNENNIIVAGGMENMSMIPFYLEKARYGYGYGNGVLIDGLAKDGLTDAYQPLAMGCFGDATAARYNISREEQDNFAIESYKRAAAAWQSGVFNNEVVPVEVTDRKGNVKVVAEDEEFKNVNFDKIPALKPVFTKDGTVTAANASTINDGAAALVLCSAETVERDGLKPVARIIAYADAEQEPEWFTTSPVYAAQKALKRVGLSVADIDFFEVNEAFSVVPIVFCRELGISYDKLNIFGGAVSLGHPLGCSGARIIATLINVLQQKNGKYGLAAICNGGGGASAIVIEKL